MFYVNISVSVAILFYRVSDFLTGVLSKERLVCMLSAVRLIYTHYEVVLGISGQEFA